ncbi:MAG: hypothetical protein LCH32_03560 [Bacteroidetes bacterium]|nr:hypothetical protein [Bacteroidota bacterium]
MHINLKSNWSTLRILNTVIGVVIFIFSVLKLDYLTSLIGIALILIGLFGFGTSSKECCNNNCNKKN